MRRVSVAVVLALAVVGAPLAAGHLGGPVAQPTSAGGGGDTTGNDSGNVPPGAALAGVVAAQNASVSGAFEASAFDVRYRGAASDDGRAGVLAAQSQRIDERIDSLRERQEQLLAAHENGTISTGRYHAEAATIAAEIRSLQRIANATADRADRLPAAALAEHGVELAAVHELAADARNLTGPAVARIARGLGGAGNAAGPGAPEAPGTVSDQRATAAIDGADDRIESVRERLERQRDRLDEEAIATAEGRLERAEDSLAAARAALDDDRPARALTLAGDAEGHARVAGTTLSGVGVDVGIGGSGPGTDAGDGATPDDAEDSGETDDVAPN